MVSGDKKVKCTNCSNEIESCSEKCQFCESKTQSNMLYCPKCGHKQEVLTNKRLKFFSVTLFCKNCGYKQKVSTNKHLKWFFIIFFLLFFAPIIFSLIISLAVIGITSKVININDLITIIKGIIYVIILVPMLFAILGWMGKALKTSQKKDIICIVLSIISLSGLVCFNTYTKNSKIQFKNYNKQEVITLNNVSVPTLYNVTNYDDTFVSMKIKIKEDGIRGDGISIITHEEIPQEILLKYKDMLISNEYNYLGNIENADVYVLSKGEYYMLLGFTNDNKTIFYLSLDKDNYNKVLNQIKNS